MARVRKVAVLAVLACLLALPAAASATSPTAVMVAKVNQFRRQHGERSLVISNKLMHSAGAYSGWMMSTGFFGHLARIQASHSYHTLGEIIEYHYGERSSVNLTFNDWLHSPPHRAVILYPGFRFVGAGLTEGHFRGHRATLWVMHFGRP